MIFQNEDLLLVKEQTRDEGGPVVNQEIQQLVDVQSDYFRALIDRLSNGEAFIQITSDGLEVELEQFMMKILERIQVRASSEAQSFLPGLPNV